MMEDLNVISDDQDRPVFCSKHRESGIMTYKVRGMTGLAMRTFTKKDGKPKVPPKKIQRIDMSSP